MTRHETRFELSISAREDGTLEAVYIQVSDREVARTEEIIEDVLLADYDAKGRIVGFEILAPVKIGQLIERVDRPKRASLNRFIEVAAPKQFITA